MVAVSHIWVKFGLCPASQISSPGQLSRSSYRAIIW